MKFIPLKLQGAFVVEFDPKGDPRGYFMRVYDESLFQEHGLTTRWVQDNQSMSERKHTLRGLHMQSPPHEETKLVRVVQGKILDVMVDLRKGSETFGQWEAVELSEDNWRAAYIPRGFAHGFCTLTEHCVVQYKVDNYYAPQAECGVKWNDPFIGIQWPTSDPVLSEKDGLLPTLEQSGRL